jgi:uncharacterized protein (TIGR03118 family)
MKLRLSSPGRPPKSVLAASALLAAASLTLIGAAAQAAPARASSAGTVLQTNLVSDLPGVAAVTDPNLVNAWGISESGTSPFWISDNNAGVSTLYQVPGANNAPVTTVPLVVNIPTPVDTTGGTPTGTVFNFASGNGAFKVTGPNKNGVSTTAAAMFLFVTEDGTILGWNPAIDPTGKFAGPGGVSAQAVIAKDNSGNNFTNPDPAKQTGAVYKGQAIATSTTPIIPRDRNSTALLYASNFRAGTIEAYDANFNKVTALPRGAFTDRDLPRGYAPFNVQVLNGKLYVTYAKQDAFKHDDAAGPHRGFVDVYNLDGAPGLPGGKVRLISRGPLNSPWGLAIAPLGQLRDPDGEPIVIDGLWALKVGNGGAGGAANTVYFTAGPFGESHGLFGSLTTAAPGSPEGQAEGQWVQANLDVVQLDLQQLNADLASGAPLDTIKMDSKTLNADTRQLVIVERAFAADAIADSA